LQAAMPEGNSTWTELEKLPLFSELVSVCLYTKQY
jgi:hypothetical protein